MNYLGFPFRSTPTSAGQLQQLSARGSSAAKFFSTNLDTQFRPRDLLFVKPRIAVTMPLLAPPTTAEQDTGDFTFKPIQVRYRGDERSNASRRSARGALSDAFGSLAALASFQACALLHGCMSMHVAVADHLLA
jgi:hypothetical protein